MKYTKERIYKGGSMSVNFHTGARTIVGTNVGVKLKISGKCPVCKKTRSRTECYDGYVNNGMNPLSEEEMMVKYRKAVDERVERLESGESTLQCHCGATLV